MRTDLWHARKQQTVARSTRRGLPSRPPAWPHTSACTSVRAPDHGQHTAKAWSRCVRGVDLAAVHNHEGVWRQAPKLDNYLRNETTASNTVCVQPSPSRPHQPSYLDHPPYVRAPPCPTVAAVAMPRSTTTSPAQHGERTVSRADVAPASAETG